MMDLEEQLRVLLIERQQTLNTMQEQLQQLQNLLLVLAQYRNDNPSTIRVKRFF